MPAIDCHSNKLYKTNVFLINYPDRYQSTTYNSEVLNHA